MLSTVDSAPLVKLWRWNKPTLVIPCRVMLSNNAMLVRDLGRGDLTTEDTVIERIEIYETRWSGLLRIVNYVWTAHRKPQKSFWNFYDYLCR